MKLSRENSVQLPDMTQQSLGGAVRGISESFQPHLSSGTSGFTFPFELPESRELTPEIILNYSSGFGNGVFGMGFDIQLLSVKRSTQFGVPRYDQSDNFVLSGYGELVETKTCDTFSIYRPRVDTRFSDIEHHHSNDENFWIIRESNGVVHRLGVAVAQDEKKRIFQWSIVESKDAKGNRVVYNYEQDDHSPNCYVKHIYYGNYRSSSKIENFLFDVQFVYDLNRIDTIKNYRAGFLRETNRLCRRIELYHQLHESHFGIDNSEKTIAVKKHYWKFHYVSDSKDQIDQLSLTHLYKLESIGCRRNNAGDIVEKALPPVDFYYTKLDVQKFEPFELNKDAAKPGMLGRFQFLDLYQEGLPGILYADGTTTLFWRSEGGGKFAAPKSLTEFPLNGNLSSRNYTLKPLGRDKEMALVVYNSGYAGYYRMHREKGHKKGDNNKHNIFWDQLNTFDQCPNDASMKQSLSLDLNGTGSADCVVLNLMNPHYFPSNGEKGFQSAQSLTFADKDNPFPMSSSDASTIRTFATIFGDGLLHRVEVSDGKLSVWPNLGHGQFGKSITIDIPKYSNDLSVQFHSANVFLADIDGSGMSDLVYAYSDHCRIFLNRGDQFTSEPIKIKFPDGIHYTQFDQINFGDLLGQGVTSMLLTNNTTEGVTHFHLPLSVQKPHLLNKIINHGGTKTTIGYSVSTKNYLKQRKKGTLKANYPVLPFAMPILEHIEIHDTVSDLRITHRYRYTGGYYNNREREFGGYALVEQWDTEELNDNQSDITSTKYVKQWYACGDPIENNYRADYYAKVEHGIDHLLNHILEEARALSGKLLRAEVYDNKKQAIPYQVAEYSYSVYCQQKPDEKQNTRGVFIVKPREQMTYHIEAQNEPPRIEHTLFLEWDASYANLLKECQVCYGRADGQLPSLDKSISIDPIARKKIVEEQERTFMVYNERHYYEPRTVDKTFVYKHTPTETKTYSLELVNTSVLTFKKANDLFCDAELERLQRYHYRYSDLKTIPLLHHVTSLLGNSDDAEKWYKPLLKGQENIHTLLKASGYLLNEKESWWMHGKTYHYDDEHFYQINLITYFQDEDSDRLFYKRKLDYGKYSLKIIKITDYLDEESGYSTEITYDYQSLTACQVVDHNENATLTLTDPLGITIAKTLYGQCGDQMMGNPPKGKDTLSEADLNQLSYDKSLELKDVKLSDIVANPTILMSSKETITWLKLYTYQFGSPIKDPNQPSYGVHIISKHYEADADKNDPMLLIDYYNGFGRIAQTKIKSTEDGDAKKQWFNSGRVCYNQKGLVYQRYLPYDSESYESQDPSKSSEKLPPPLTNYYDAMDRLIKQVMPNQSVRKQRYSAWARLIYDENDTSADKNSVHKNTPTVLFYSAHDLICAQVNIIRSNQAGDVKCQTIISHFNSLGEVQYYHDLRLYDQDPNITFERNLLRDLVARISVDSGKEYFLADRDSNKIRHKHGTCLTIREFDAWSRQVKLCIGDSMIEEKKYGEKKESATKNNLHGRLVEWISHDGVTRNEQFDLHGNAIHTTHEIKLPAMKDIGYQPFKDCRFEFKEKYNAINQLVEHTLPGENDQTTHVLKHNYTQLGQLNKVDLDDNEPAIKDIAYYNSGNRKSVCYGNEMTTTYEYDQETQRLHRLSSQINEQSTLQDNTFTRDLVGNIVQIDVPNIALSFSKNDSFKLPEQSYQYEYDSLSRLIKATGRELVDSPVTSELTKTPSCVLDSDNERKDEFKQFTQEFSYDISGNLVQLTHGHKGDKAWEISHSISEKSNQLTSTTREKKEEKHAHDLRGNMKKIGESHNLTWSDNNQLQEVELKDINGDKISESYGCQTKDRSNLFINKLDVKQAKAYNPRFFNPVHDDTHPREKTKAEEVIRSYSSRIFKLIHIQKIDKNSVTHEIIENVYLGAYERKRMWQYNEEDLPGNFELVLERHSINIVDDHRQVATFHIWVVDKLRLETPQNQKEFPYSRIFYQLTDQINSVVMQIDQDGYVATFQEFQAYAGPAFVISINDQQMRINGYHYSSKEEDRTGFYYYGERRYAHWLGRWISADPAGLVDGLNVYGFAEENPVNYIDYFGLTKENKYIMNFTSKASLSNIDPSTLPPGVYEILESFGHPDQQTVQNWEDLAGRFGYEVEAYKGIVSESMKAEIKSALDAIKPVYFGSNEFLGPSWENSVDGYGGSKTGIPLYTAIRKKETRYFKDTPIEYSGGVTSLNEVLYTVSGTPANVHHLAYKSLYPQHASATNNLTLFERSPSEKDFGSGQHELLHKLASGNQKNKFRICIPQFVEVCGEWVKDIEMAKQNLQGDQFSMMLYK